MQFWVDITQTYVMWYNLEMNVSKYRSTDVQEKFLQSLISVEWQTANDHCDYCKLSVLINTVRLLTAILWDFSYNTMRYNSRRYTNIAQKLTSTASFVYHIRRQKLKINETMKVKQKWLTRGRTDKRSDCYVMQLLCHKRISKTWNPLTTVCLGKDGQQSSGHCRREKTR